MNREEISQLAFDCVLPAAIFFNDNLEPNCIKLYAIVRNLTKIHGYCFATNEYLEKTLRVERTSVKRWLASLSKEGYLRIQIIRDGLQTQRLIYLSDKFKKSLRRCKIAPPPVQNCTPPGAKLHPIKEKSIRNEEYSKEKIDEEKSSISSLPAQKKELPKESKDASAYLLEKLVKLYPEHRTPNLDLWAKDFDLLNRIDKRSWDEIRKTIDYALESSFWAKVILSPDGLRRNWIKIRAQMIPIDNGGSRMQRNRAMAHEAKSILKYDQNKWKNFYISEKEVVRLDSNEKVSLELDSKIFESTIAKIFGLKVV